MCRWIPVTASGLRCSTLLQAIFLNNYFQWSKFFLASSKIFLPPYSQILFKFDLDMRTKMQGGDCSLKCKILISGQINRGEARNAKLCFFFKI